MHYILGDGTTHYVDYEARNMGRDWATALCGERVHIQEYAQKPSCLRCLVAQIKERLKRGREKEIPF